MNAVAVPNRLPELRRERGLGTTELAARIGVSERQLRRWEAGQSGIPDMRKLQLADLLSVTVAELMRWE